MIPGFLFDVLPWWLAVPLLQIGLLGLGMALDETYVNRATVITGALALYVHVVVAGGAWLPVGLYLDAGVVIGVYGLYAYIVDAYVSNWFRFAAYFLYSPLSIFLVIIVPDLLFPIALVAAAYGNLQLMAHLEPNDPYYFGPSDLAEFEAVVRSDDPANAEDGADGGFDVDDVGTAAAADGTESDRPNADPAATGGDSTERGVLPEFMRRL